LRCPLHVGVRIRLHLSSPSQDLQYELARITKAHNDVIRVYESKLTEFGIPVEELGFRPLVTSTGTGPAGLVVG